VYHIEAQDTALTHGWVGQVSHNQVLGLSQAAFYIPLRPKHVQGLHAGIPSDSPCHASKNGLLSKDSFQLVGHV